MRYLSKASVILLSAFLSLAYAADKPSLFRGIINADGINVRSDSTVSAQVLCKVGLGDTVEVVQELYDWYKIRLPKEAASFINKGMVTLTSEKTARVLKNNVNIRLEPSASSWILGQADPNEIVTLLEDRGEWYKIEPVRNSFGWIHKKFVAQAPVVVEKIEEAKPPKEVKEEKPKNVFEGIVKPYGMVFRRKGTHKFITADKRIFLIRGDKQDLDHLNYHKVRITGEVIPPLPAKIWLIATAEQKYPRIEIETIEALN